MKLTNEELDEILAKGGLRINQPYDPQGLYREDQYIFTTCTKCGVQAHYQLKYILDRNEYQEQVCRVCYWLTWYGGYQKLYNKTVHSMIKQGASRKDLIEQGVITQKKGPTWDKASELAEEHGYDLVDLFITDRESDEVLVVRCKSCGRQTVKRPNDVRYRCPCIEKKSGIPFGKEIKKPSTPLSKRDIAPRTPGAANIISYFDHHIPNSQKYDYSDLKEKTIADVPELRAAWDEDTPPEKVSVIESGLVHLVCPKGHHPYQSPYSYLVDGCMVCRGLATKAKPNSGGLRASNPELAEEWLYALDGDKYTPDSVKSGSKRKVMWRCMACGHEWKSTVHDRELRMNNRCPKCGKVMGSLAWKYPEVARVWSPKNPVSPWNIKPHSVLDFKPEWVCQDNPNHTWTCRVETMIKRKGKCPICSKNK